MVKFTKISERNGYICDNTYEVHLRGILWGWVSGEAGAWYGLRKDDYMWCGTYRNRETAVLANL